MPKRHKSENGKEDTKASKAVAVFRSAVSTSFGCVAIKYECVTRRCKNGRRRSAAAAAARPLNVWWPPRNSVRSNGTTMEQ